MTELVVLVDEHDLEIGVADKLTAHKLGQLHRAFSIFIFRESDDDLEVLLQRRHRDKYHSGNLWTNTCCSHPRPNEQLLTAAKRRLFEEVGITTDLWNIGNFTYKTTFPNNLIEHEFDHVLVGKHQNNKIMHNPKEIHELRWISCGLLTEELSKEPASYSYWLPLAWQVIINDLKWIKQNLF